MCDYLRKATDQKVRNGTATTYDPQTNLILVGEVEWCDTVTPKSAEKLRSVSSGSHGPEWRHGIRSTCSAYYALDAATGEKLWGQGLGGDVIT